MHVCIYYMCTYKKCNFPLALPGKNASAFYCDENIYVYVYLSIYMNKYTERMKTALTEEPLFRRRTNQSEAQRTTGL